MGIMTRLRSGWNAFLNRDPTEQFINIGYGSSNKPYRTNLSGGRERSIATAIFNKIAMDCSSIDIRHVKTDENKRFIEYVNSGLDNCLTLEANIDQTGKAFIQDVVLSMLDEGVVAIVPVDTDIDPTNNNSVTIETMRTGKIKEWFPRHVLVEVYNDRTGIYEDLTLPKTSIAIVENPLYAVINEHNSTLQRLVRKLVLLDNLDNQVKHLGIYIRFKRVRGTNSTHGKGKLDEAFSLIEEEGLNREETLLVGDSTHDYEVAQRCGFKCLLIASGHQAKYRLEKVCPSVEDDFKDILKYID